MKLNSESSWMEHMQHIFNFAHQSIAPRFNKDKPLEVILIHSATSSEESGYFLYFAGGINHEECFFLKPRVTAGPGIFEPGIYFLENQIGGAVLMPSHKIEASALALGKVHFRTGRTWESELEGISSSFEEFVRNYFHRS